MSAYFFSVELADDRTLFLAPLTERRIAMSGQDITDCSGYFLFEKTGKDGVAEIEILAQAMSEEAAFRLKDMLNMH